MNRILKNTLIIAALSLFVISCEPVDDPEPTDGDPRSAIEDTWECNEDSPAFGITSYYVGIDKDPNNTDNVLIDNFYDLGIGIDVSARLSGNNLSIETQQIGDGFTVSGTGIISSNKKIIDLTYSVDDGGGSEPVTASYTRD